MKTYLMRIALVLMAIAVLCGVLVGRFPVIRISQTMQVVEIKNEVYKLICDRSVSDDQVIAAAKKDVPRTLSFCMNRFNLLNIAIQENRLKVVKAFVEMGFSPNEVGACDEQRVMYPLFSAICHDRIEIAKFLIQKGADINKTSSGGYTLFELAYLNGTPKMQEVFEEAKRNQISITRPTTE